jgi:hypothetical protein
MIMIPAPTLMSTHCLHLSEDTALFCGGKDTQFLAMRYKKSGFGFAEPALGFWKQISFLKRLLP